MCAILQFYSILFSVCGRCGHHLSACRVHALTVLGTLAPPVVAALMKCEEEMRGLNRCESRCAVIGLSFRMHLTCYWPASQSNKHPTWWQSTDHAVILSRCFGV